MKPIIITTKEVFSMKRRIFILGMVLLCLGTAALAEPAVQPYLAEIARLTKESGDYETWTPDEKRALLQSMSANSLMDAETARAMSAGPEADIDAFLLKRYAPPDAPNGLDAISLYRIAWVELGNYTYWPNETWVWFTNMMFDAGLWTEKNDVDVYEAPGEDAIPPETAIELAKRQLLRGGVAEEELEQAQIIWQYMTHANDVERKELKYLITFRYPGGQDQHVWITPDGQVV